MVIHQPLQTHSTLTPEPSAEAVRSWLSVVQAYNLCDALLARELAKIGLRNAEYEVLSHLLRSPGLSQQALSERCFIAKSHISALLTVMQERAWLRRENHPQDARAKSLFLEPAGQEVAERGRLVQTQVVKVMAQAISPEQMRQVHEAMLAVNLALEAQLR
jgi:DNA-binding MarR family transcriptional regulator